eukprot:gene15188-20459_t
MNLLILVLFLSIPPLSFSFLQCMKLRHNRENIIFADQRSELSRGNNPKRKSSGVGSKNNALLQGKVARLLRDELSEIICECDIKAKVYPSEKLLKGVAIADIELSGDLSMAKVYISVLGNSVEKRQVFVWLCENIGQVKFSLSKRLRSLRKVPEITFSLVDSQATFYLNDIIDEFSLPPVTVQSAEIDIDFEEDDE